MYHYREKDSSRNFSSSNSLQIVPKVSITRPRKLLQEIKQQLPMLQRKPSISRCLSNQNKALASVNEIQCSWVLAISSLELMKGYAYTAKKHNIHSIWLLQVE